MTKRYSLSSTLFLATGASLLTGWRFDLSFSADYLADGVFRRDDHNQVEIINSDILLCQLYSRHRLENFEETLVEMRRHARIQDPPSIFWDPDHMIFSSVGAMAR